MTDQLTTVNILNLFETSKRERETFVDDIVSRLESGEADAIKVHLQIKCMESIIKDLNGNSKYKDYLLTAAENNGRKFTYHNAEFSIKEAGVKYDYSQCNDRTLMDLEYNQNLIDNEIKARQTFLKAVPLAGLEIREGDELVTIYPPSKVSTTTVNVILK